MRAAVFVAADRETCRERKRFCDDCALDPRIFVDHDFRQTIEGSRALFLQV